MFSIFILVFQKIEMLILPMKHSANMYSTTNNAMNNTTNTTMCGNPYYPSESPPLRVPVTQYEIPRGIPLDSPEWNITKSWETNYQHPQISMPGIPDIAIKEGDVLPMPALALAVLPNPEMVIHIPRVLCHMANDRTIREIFNHRGIGLVDDVEFVGPHIIKNENTQQEYYEAYVYLCNWYPTAANRYIQEKILEKNFKAFLVYEFANNPANNSYWILNVAHNPKSYMERCLQKENMRLKSLLVDRDFEHMEEIASMRAEHDDEIDKLNQLISKIISTNNDNYTMTIPDEYEEYHREVLETDLLHDENLSDIQSQEDLPYSRAEYEAEYPMP